MNARQQSQKPLEIFQKPAHSRVEHLVIGADGFVGSALTEALMSSGASVMTTTRRKERTRPASILLDLNHVEAFRNVVPAAVVAYICAAITSMKACEEDPSGTASINLTGTANLGHLLHAAGTFVILPSSNAVFDGSRPFLSPRTPDSPVTEYGRQKAGIERQLLSMGRASVVRFTKVVSGDLPLFREWMLSLKQGRPIYPLSDLLFAPVTLQFAVSVLEWAGRSRQEGIFHVSGEEDVSYGEFARRLASRMGADAGLVRPRSASQAGVALPTVNRFTSLGMQTKAGEFPFSPQPVEEVIDFLLKATLSQNVHDDIGPEQGFTRHFHDQ